MSLSSIIADLSKDRRIAERQLASAEKAYSDGRIRGGFTPAYHNAVTKRRAILQRIADLTLAIEALRCVEAAAPKPILCAGMGEREPAIFG